jgi:hypothetical protein
MFPHAKAARRPPGGKAVKKQNFLTDLPGIFLLQKTYERIFAAAGKP